MRDAATAFVRSGFTRPADPRDGRVAPILDSPDGVNTGVDITLLKACRSVLSPTDCVSAVRAAINDGDDDTRAAVCANFARRNAAMSHVARAACSTDAPAAALQRAIGVEVEGDARPLVATRSGATVDAAIGAARDPSARWIAPLAVMCVVPWLLVLVMWWTGYTVVSSHGAPVTVRRAAGEGAFT